VDEQIESMIPEIREKLQEMMTEEKAGFPWVPLHPVHSPPDSLAPLGFIRHNDTHYTLTLSAFQGHCTYILNNTFGPAPPPKEKGELPKEPLVELVCFSTIEYEQVLQVCPHPPPA
jgi:hypothetical protein